MPRCACGAELPIHPAPHRLPVLLEHLPVPVGAVLLPGDGDDRVAPTGRAGHHGELVVEMVLDAAPVRGEVGDAPIIELVVAQGGEPFPTEPEHVVEACRGRDENLVVPAPGESFPGDRKSTRLNSSHVAISY